MVSSNGTGPGPTGEARCESVVLSGARCGRCRLRAHTHVHAHTRQVPRSDAISYRIGSFDCHHCSLHTSPCLLSARGHGPSIPRATERPVAPPVVDGADDRRTTPTPRCLACRRAAAPRYTLGLRLTCRAPPAPPTPTCGIPSRSAPSARRGHPGRAASPSRRELPAARRSAARRLGHGRAHDGARRRV